MNRDRDIVAAALRHEPAAVEQLVQRLGCVARMLASRNARIGSPLRQGELVEAAQDVLVKVWENLPDFRGDAALETWVYRFCEFGLMNAVRQRGRALAPVPEELPEPWREPGLDTSELERVYTALARLSEDEARVVRQRHFGGQPFDAIAAESGQPLTTVKSRYYRALGKLRLWLTSTFDAESQA